MITSGAQWAKPFNLHISKVLNSPVSSAPVLWIFFVQSDYLKAAAAIDVWIAKPLEANYDRLNKTDLIHTFNWPPVKT